MDTWLLRRVLLSILSTLPVLQPTLNFRCLWKYVLGKRCRPCFFNVWEYHSNYNPCDSIGHSKTESGLSDCPVSAVLLVSPRCSWFHFNKLEHLVSNSHLFIFRNFRNLVKENDNQMKSNEHLYCHQWGIMSHYHLILSNLWIISVGKCVFLEMTHSQLVCMDSCSFL